MARPHPREDPYGPPGPLRLAHHKRLYLVQAVLAGAAAALLLGGGSSAGLVVGGVLAVLAAVWAGWAYTPVLRRSPAEGVVVSGVFPWLRRWSPETATVDVVPRRRLRGRYRVVLADGGQRHRLAPYSLTADEVIQVAEWWRRATGRTLDWRPEPPR